MVSNGSLGLGNSETSERGGDDQGAQGSWGGGTYGVFAS